MEVCKIVVFTALEKLTATGVDHDPAGLLEDLQPEEPLHSVGRERKAPFDHTVSLGTVEVAPVRREDALACRGLQGPGFQLQAAAVLSDLRFSRQIKQGADVLRAEEQRALAVIGAQTQQPVDVNRELRPLGRHSRTRYRERGRGRRRRCRGRYFLTGSE